MKITDIRTYNVFSFQTNFVFVEIYTDEGLSGLGEGTLEYKENALLGAIEDIKRVLIGQDPMEIERITSLLYRDSYWRVGPVLQSAISAVEMALWDIKGKYYNAPVYELLGGRVRDRVRMYGHLKPTGHPGDFTISDMLRITDRRFEEGFTVMKYSVIPPIKPIDSMEMVDKVVERFAAVRERVGKAVDIAVDFHGRVSPAMSIRLLKELEPYVRHLCAQQLHV